MAIKDVFQMPSAASDRERIQGALSEICDHLTHIASYNELVKECCAVLKDEYAMPAPTSRKLGKIMLEQNFAATQEKYETLEELYEILVKPKMS